MARGAEIGCSGQRGARPGQSEPLSFQPPEWKILEKKMTEVSQRGTMAWDIGRDLTTGNRTPTPMVFSLDSQICCRRKSWSGGGSEHGDE